MLLPVLVFTGVLQLVRVADAEELSVIRHADSDIFTAEGACNGACGESSSGTGSLYSRGTAAPTTGISVTNGTCVCQCNVALPVFREDLHICVSDIHECSVTGFVSNSGLVEKVPYVFLPQRGQIIYPQAEIRFEGVTSPVCGIAGSQQLGKSGWIELRNLSNAEPPFRLFRDEGRTFLQWIGEDGLRDSAEGKVVVAKLVCRDASPSSTNPGVFTPCVAFRVAGSPSKSNIREVTFASTGQTPQGLSVTEYTAIGISSVILAIIYVASVSLYLHSRKARKRCAEEPEVAITGGREGAGLVKNNPLLVSTRHYESDTNSATSENENDDELAQSDGEQIFENPSYNSRQVTSAIIHPHCMYVEHTEGPFGAGAILGERIPEEDVRIVETIDNAYQQDALVLPGTQRRKLYFNPAYFERQLLLAPPPAAIEFLMKIREVISIAKHKMSAKRFVPTLTGIPEEETASERCSSTRNKRGANSIQGSVARSRKSQRCTGCPGCTESPSKSLPQLPDVGRPMIGENRVRAWLEDVKAPEKRWKEAEECGRNNREDSRAFAANFECLKEIGKIDFSRNDNSTAPTGRSLASWKDNPAMLRTFRNIARSEICVEDDRHSLSKRSTESMFEQSGHDRYRGRRNPWTDHEGKEDGENAINAKVRRAIENSFIKQMEENATMNEMDDREIGKSATIVDDNCNAERSRSTPPPGKSTSNGTQKRARKSRAPDAPIRQLPDMLNQLPSSKIPAKRIMDAVIKEMVDVKALEHHSRCDHQVEYEIDSLERSAKRSASFVTSAEEFEVKASPVNGNAGNSNNEIVARPEEPISRPNDRDNLPELLSAQRREGYSLVSEVYVNDGYASPAGSDDSGPEITYETENPGHLTIKVQDSPENYVRQDESEYEPDTLDRKPMRLKINGDVSYDRETTSESYVDSLERPGHILLRSKGSFRNDGPAKSDAGSLQRGYGSLREIYEAKLRANLKDSSLMASTRSLNGDYEKTLSWRKNKYLTPDKRHAKRQRKPQSQPDVVPFPPSEEIYQKPKPPRRIEENVVTNGIDDTDDDIVSKNELDRSKSDVGDPAANDGSPVVEISEIEHRVGNQTSKQRRISRDDTVVSSELTNGDYTRDKDTANNEESFDPAYSSPVWRHDAVAPWRLELEKRSRCHLPADRCHDGAKNGSTKRHQMENGAKTRDIMKNHGFDDLRGQKGTSTSRKTDEPSGGAVTLGKVEDSGYLSSTDSNESQKRLLSRHDNGSVSETDETESMCDGASESGAESVGTDSVFFGNFRRLSDVSNFSKSVDSGVDFSMRNTFFKPFGARNEKSSIDVRASDSENESFVTVFSPNNGTSRRNSLVS